MNITKGRFTEKRFFFLWMLPHPWSMFKKSITKCKFDKIDIIQYVLYLIRAIPCRYENGTLICIAIFFRFLNNQPISQKKYVYMIIIPFYILSSVKIWADYLTNWLGRCSFLWVLIMSNKQEIKVSFWSLNMGLVH